MRSNLLLLLLSTLYVAGFAQGPQTTINVPINSSQTRPALLYLPDDYNSTTTQYPLLIFLHGNNESGNDLSKIYNHAGSGGPAYFIAHGQWPATGFVNPANAQTYKFIVVSPQASSNSITESQLNYIIPDLIADYRVDTSRIYLMGISFGGEGVVKYAGRQGITPTRLPAAIVPLSAVINSSQINNIAASMNTDNIRAWGMGDDLCGDIHGILTRDLINAMKNNNPGIARFTRTNKCHSLWNQWIIPTYKELINGTQMNIYEWILQFSRQTIVNQPPTVHAGTDQSITLPTSSVNLSATASDGDGSVVSYSWTKIAGGSATITSPSLASTSVTGLTQGTYTFRCTVTDNNGAVASDDVNVQVNGASNLPPSVNAGNDQTITLPGNSVNVTATATDGDGTVVSYSWTKISGGSANIFTPAAATTTISGLAQGTYVFRCTVTDDDGATASDDVTIQVNPANRFVYVNLYGNGQPANLTDWNDWDITTSLNKSNLAFTDQSPGTFDVSLSAQTNYFDNGSSYTGFTMCPNIIGRYGSAHTGPRTLTISDLDNSKRYEISLIASVSGITSSTVFTVNGSVVTVAVGNNKSISATFSNIAPGSGNIVVNISNGSGSAANYLNGFKITESTPSGSRMATADDKPPIAIKIGPNPAKDQITVITAENNIKWIRIFDVQGRLRKQHRYNNSSSVHLNISDLYNGIYFVEIQQGNRNTKHILNIKR